MRIAVYGSLLCGCRAVWAANGRTTCCTFFLSRWVETEELAGTDSAGVKLCCSHAWACATCHGERGSEDTKQTLQQKVLDIPLQKGLMKRVRCFLSRQEEAVKPCLLWEKGNICLHLYFSSLHQNKVKFLFLSKIRVTALILGMKNLLSSYWDIDKKNGRPKASAAEIFAAAFCFQVNLC